MNTNRESPQDESDDALDRAIRVVTAQPPPLDVKNRVIETVAAFTPSSRARARPATRRSWLILASAAAAISAACLITFLLLPVASIGWADVNKAVQSQPWIRVTTTYPEAREDKHNTMWLSPQRQVWAFQSDYWFVFFDGRRQEKYEYHPRDKQIVKMPLREDESQQILSVDYLSQGSWLFGTEKVVSQKRQEVREAGRKWIDFEIVFFRGDDKVGTLRVDPETRLPVYLATKSHKWTFDYPADGPTDIYALGVPAQITIDDRMPSEDCLRVLRAMAASRARIGDFRLVVAVGRPNRGVSSIVWRKGNRWRIDMCESETVLPRNKWGAKPPDGLGWGDPFAEQLKLCWVGPNLICDGRMVYKNTQPVPYSRHNDPKAQGGPAVTWQVAPSITPQDLLSGEGLGRINLAPYAKIASLVYPDLSPRPGWGFEFDPRPVDAPGCVLIKRSARTTRKEPTRAHEWYYIDPAKGHAVVRAELFNLPADAPADPKPPSARQSIRMEDFQQSPQGFWYPKVIHDAHLPMPDPNEKDGSQVRYRISTVHYHFDFDVALPDSLFVIDDASKPKE